MHAEHLTEIRRLIERIKLDAAGIGDLESQCLAALPSLEAIVAEKQPAGEGVFAILFQNKRRLVLGEPHKSRECAVQGVSPFEGALVVGIVSGTLERLPEPVMGMKFALQQAGIHDR